MKIIIVEDEKSIRNGLVKMLPKLDPEYEVVGSAKDGSEGYQRILAEQPDLVIMDIEMPEMDGHRLTKLIKDDDRLKKLPVIIFSSLVNEQMRQKGKELGADEQLSKPEIGHLVAIMDELLARFKRQMV